MGNTFPIMNAKRGRTERRIPGIQNKTTPKGDLVLVTQRGFARLRAGRLGLQGAPGALPGALGSNPRTTKQDHPKG